MSRANQGAVSLRPASVRVWTASTTSTSTHAATNSQGIARQRRPGRLRSGNTRHNKAKPISWKTHAPAATSPPEDSRVHVAAAPAATQASAGPTVLLGRRIVRSRPNTSEGGNKTAANHTSSLPTSPSRTTHTTYVTSAADVAAHVRCAVVIRT